MVFNIYTDIILYIFTLHGIYQSKELVEKTEAKMVEWEKQLVALSNAADKVDIVRERERERKRPNESEAARCLGLGFRV